MKKIIVFLFVSLAVMQGANAQLGIFNHLTIGANVGTPGIGADVAMPVTRFFAKDHVSSRYFSLKQ